MFYVFVPYNNNNNIRKTTTMLFHDYFMMAVSLSLAMLFVADGRSTVQGQTTNTTNNNVTTTQPPQETKNPCLALDEIIVACQAENNCTTCVPNDKTVMTWASEEQIDFTNYTQVLLFSYTKLDELCLGVATISCGMSECCPSCQHAYEKYGDCGFAVLTNTLVDEMVEVTVNFTNIPGFIDLEDLCDELSNGSCTYSCDLLSITSF